MVAKEVQGDSMQEPKDETRIVAEWVGSKATPAMHGMVRRLTKKEVSESLVMVTTRDLEWSEEHNFRADVSTEPTEFVEWLEKQPEFKVTRSG